MADANAAPIGVLLANLGTPDAPTPAALRRYLREFLSDPRVVDLPRAVWLPVLHGIILTVRPRKSAALYRKVWTDAGSPLLVTGRRQQAGLQARLDAEAPGAFRVELAMRYGRPSIAEGLAALARAGCGRVLVLPLYPQYSSTTTASTMDAVADALRGRRDVPELRFIRDYHDRPAWVEAMAASIREDFEARGAPERLLFSFHGIPKRYADTGDPYPEQCRRSARLVAERLGLADEAWTMAFQSRFGREEWLRPYTDETLAELAAAGVRDVAVVCPGFAADCLETLEEIAMQNRDIFLGAGGERYRYIPALNDRDDHLRMLTGLVREHAAGWLGHP